MISGIYSVDASVKVHKNACISPSIKPWTIPIATVKFFCPEQFLDVDKGNFKLSNGAYFVMVDKKYFNVINKEYGATEFR